ncbi:Uncharacterized protein C20orf96 [Antrostomus carolinensis]|uniref:Uncharacterized protein C20orf96 n=1 Tax=Antrostomus carolinensis TaxID=279965 RepID=A0A094KXK9_ANTCR|nr:Uncharacterized protein C20orf96 [Antrostomus carolinensis]
MEDIQHTDDSTAKEARDLLQQHEVFQRTEAMLQIFNQNQLDAARAELQELEKTREKNLGKLQQQLDEVTSKVQVLQDELSVLQTYINDGQDKAEDMGKAVLEELEEKTRVEQEALLQKVLEEMLLHQDGLKQMVINNHVLRREILRQREIIKDLEEEIGELKRSIQTLRQSTRNPRELIFADVFLHRPK